MRIDLIISPTKRGYIELPDDLTLEGLEVIWEQLEGLRIYHKAMAKAQAIKKPAQTADGATSEAP
jgi:hypothetical protein